MTVPGRRALPPALSFVLCGLVLTLWACTPTDPVVTPQPTQAPLNGAALEPAVNLPELWFTRSDGGTFTTAKTFGRTSLFFFGYTHCADVCPLTLAEFGQIRRALGSDAADVDMYFVTLDPSRDTPERMRTYLTSFQGVVGLVGADADLAHAQSAFNVVAERRDLGNGDYAIDHTGAIYLVNSASQIQLAYPYGTSSDEIVSDLRRLVAGARPVEPTVSGAWARPADEGGTSAIYIRIQNGSDRPDRLVSVSSLLGQAEMHTSTNDNGVLRMRSVDMLTLPAHGEILFEPGDLHIMLTQVRKQLRAGDQIKLTLGFERFGSLQVDVPVRI